MTAGSVGEGLAGFSRNQGPLPLLLELAFFTRQRLSLSGREFRFNFLRGYAP